MTTANKIGTTEVLGSAIVAFAVLTNLNNGRMAQGGVLFELIAFAMFAYAARRGSRWWLLGPVIVVMFWIVAAHIDVLWVNMTLDSIVSNGVHQ